jgi:ABC-type transport system involved in multi-copper enzyme maturation permease subunit
MIWKIAKKEFLLNIMTFKFAVGAVACIVLTTVFMPILATDYRKRLEMYNKNMADNEAELRNVIVYRNIRHTVYRPPTILSAFSAGLEKQVAGSARIELEKIPELSVMESKGNPYASLFEVFDISMVFKIIMSILALLVAYDVVSGERERGTLKLLLSGTVARHQVLLGKLIAGLITLSVPVIITYIVGLVVLLSYHMVTLSGSDWIRIGLMFGVSLAFTAVLFQFGLLFSSLARRSAISMVLGLFIWIIFAIVVPNASVHLATQLNPLESQEKRDSRMMSLKEELDRELGNVKVDFSKSLVTSDDSDVFEGYYAKRRDIYWLRADQEKNALTIPIKLRYANKFLETEQSNLNSFFAQKSLARKLSYVSPISTYENVMSILAGTDINSFHYFIDLVRSHRNEVVEYIRSKTDNFSSASFFAICTEAESAEFTKLYVRTKEAEDEQSKARAKQALKEWERENPVKAVPLDLQDFPWFKYRPSTSAYLRKAMPDVAALLIMNVVLFGMCFAAFARYDVR